MKSSLPSWIKVKQYDKEQYLKTKRIISENQLNTVCTSANCPNRYECFSKGTATFMILGDTCTRNCRYCNVGKGRPKPVDVQEAKRVAFAVEQLKLNYVVITCVTRDDLQDGGASHFARTVGEIRKKSPKCKIELLISDLGGNWGALKKIIGLNPHVLNHNIETVNDLFPSLRPKGSYGLSIELLEKAKEMDSKIKTKSGIMLGLGETESQITQTLGDLKDAKCDAVTIGQYLQPSANHYKIKKYYSPMEFGQIEKRAREIGFKQVLAGPLVRSSYMAGSRG